MTDHVYLCMTDLDDSDFVIQIIERSTDVDDHSSLGIQFSRVSFHQIISNIFRSNDHRKLIGSMGVVDWRSEELLNYRYLFTVTETLGLPGLEITRVELSRYHSDHLIDLIES